MGKIIQLNSEQIYSYSNFGQRMRFINSFKIIVLELYGTILAKEKALRIRNSPTKVISV